MDKEEVIRLLFEYDNKILKIYKKNISNNFKKNSNTKFLLSERQYYILYIILYKNINTTTDIAKYLSLSKANISILTTKMEEKGYLLRNKSVDKDSRVTILTVTELGEKTFENSKERISKEVKIFLDKNVDKDFNFYDIALELVNILGINEHFENRENFMILIFIRLHTFIQEVYAKFIKENNIDLSSAEIKIINTISLFNNVNFEILAESMALSYSTLSLQAKSLDEKGYIEKVKSKDDGRVTYLVLTGKGEEISLNFNQCKRLLIVEKLDTKTQKEINDIGKLANKLVEIFSV